MMYTAIKRYYNMGLPGYTDEGIKGFVPMGWLTPEQYKDITGIEYTP